MNYQDACAAVALPWRTGRHNSQVAYAQAGETASDDDVMVGTFMAPELAEDAVRAHNAAVEARQMSPAAPAGDAMWTCPDCNEPAPHKRGECPVY